MTVTKIRTENNSSVKESSASKEQQIVNELNGNFKTSNLVVVSEIIVGNGDGSGSHDGVSLQLERERWSIQI